MRKSLQKKINKWRNKYAHVLEIEKKQAEKLQAPEHDEREVQISNQIQKMKEHEDGKENK